MTRRRTVGRAARLASLGLALLSLRSAAQEADVRLSGILLTEGAGTPVEGARVTLVDPEDVVVAEALSDRRGAFSLPTPPRGVYRIRVVRIGYESWVSDTVHVAVPPESRTLRFEVPVRPIPLAELSVSVQAVCPTTPDERERAFELYESVLPVLATMSSTADLGPLRLRLVRPITVWKRGGRQYERDTTIVVAAESFDNASPERLVAHGYAEAVNDSMTTFYVPDGDALASPGFLATHCLRTVETGDREEIGLAFEPKPGRTVVDVKGVLWIDTIAGRPREVEYRYTSLRPFLRWHLEPSLRAAVRSRIPESMWHFITFHRIEIDESRFGGALHFQRVAGGCWLIREWRIRTPTLLPRSLTEGGRKSVWPVAVPLTHSGEVLELLSPRCRGKGALIGLGLEPKPGRPVVDIGLEMDEPTNRRLARRKLRRRLGSVRIAGAQGSLEHLLDVEAE